MKKSWEELAESDFNMSQWFNMAAQQRALTWYLLKCGISSRNTEKCGSFDINMLGKVA